MQTMESQDSALAMSTAKNRPLEKQDRQLVAPESALKQRGHKSINQDNCLLVCGPAPELAVPCTVRDTSTRQDILAAFSAW